MIQIRYAQHTGVAIEGTMQELDQVQHVVLDLLAPAAQHAEIKCDAGVDPTPYEHTLPLVMVHKNNGA